MGMFDKFLKPEQRSLENPNIPVSADNFLHLMGWGDFNSSSGVVVNVENALGVPAVWAAVNFISGTLASLPLEVMRRTQGGTERLQRKQEAEARQRHRAATIRYVSWGLITAISIGGFALLYFFTEFLRGLK